MRPSAGSSIGPSTHRKNMFSPMCTIPKCRKPEVTSRYQPCGSVTNCVPSSLCQRICCSSTSRLRPRLRWALVTAPLSAPGSADQIRIADEHRDVHADQDLRDQQRLLGRPEPGPGLQVGLGRLGALETVAPDLGLDEAVGARRFAATGTPAARLTSGMSIADHPGADRGTSARRTWRPASVGGR